MHWLGNQLLCLHPRVLREASPGGLEAPRFLIFARQRLAPVTGWTLSTGLVRMDDHFRAYPHFPDPRTDLHYDPGGIASADVAWLLRMEPAYREWLALAGPEMVVVQPR